MARKVEIGQTYILYAYIINIKRFIAATSYIKN